MKRRTGHRGADRAARPAVRDGDVVLRSAAAPLSPGVSGVGVIELHGPCQRAERVFATSAEWHRVTAARGALYRPTDEPDLIAPTSRTQPSPPWDSGIAAWMSLSWRAACNSASGSSSSGASGAVGQVARPSPGTSGLPGSSPSAGRRRPLGGHAPLARTRSLLHRTRPAPT